MKLNLGPKLIVGFLPVVLVVALLGGISYRELAHLHEIADRQEELADKYREVMELSLGIKDLQGLPLHFMETGSSSYQRQFSTVHASVLKRWDRLSGGLVGEPERKVWDGARLNLNRLVEAAEATFRSGVAHDGAQSLMGALDDASDQLEADLERLRSDAEAELVVAREKVEELQFRIKYALSTAILLVAVFAVGIAIFLARRISTPLRGFVQSARRLAQGDLSVPELPVRSHDELGQMALAYNQMVRNLRKVVYGVTASAQTVAGAAQQLAVTVQSASHTAAVVESEIGRMAGGTAEQHALVQEAEPVVEQLQATIGQIATGAERQSESAATLANVVESMAAAVADVARRTAYLSSTAVHTRAAAVEGAVVVRDTVASMDHVQSSVITARDRIRSLSGLSAQIGSITEAITEIAQQTNLLALNAAIEAARAGEHGRGFAVVAAEVKRLAERAHRSAGDISELVGSIRAETMDVVRTMEGGSEAVRHGVSLAHRAGEALQGIQSMVERTTREVEAIADAGVRLATSSREVADAFKGAAATAAENSAAAVEMASGSDQVAAAMRAIATISADNHRGGETVSAVVVDLARSADEMGQAVGSLITTAQELQAQVGRFAL